MNGAEALARTVSHWVRTSACAADAGADAAATVQAALAPPEIRWTRLAEGMGVEAVRVETLEAFADAFRSACARRGPFLIEFLIA